ncbi:MAG: hypothetical protein NTZ09_03665 [Candidatus Hydrogenedentes bacterium]|nr:hypothetical protein [Candidatus Hydrogenedentota bacterium]
MRSRFISLGVLAFFVMLGASNTTARAAAEPVPAPKAAASAQKNPAELSGYCQINLKQLGLVFKMFAN